MKNALCALLIAAAGATANAELINPMWLQSSMDGPSTTVAARLTSHGYSSSVGLVSPNFGDQVDAELFQMCGEAPMNWSVQWQAAGYGPHHKLGYYNPANPSAVTWVIGGASSGLPAAASVSVVGQFGLAFYSGANNGINSDVYYSENPLNAATTNRDHLVTLNMLRGQDVMDRCGVIGSWEDAFHVDNDFNDFGFTVEGAHPVMVPAPGAIGALAAAGIVMNRRRRK